MKIKFNLKKIIHIDDYLILLLTIGIVVLVNYIFTIVPLKIDLTGQKNYSLSAQTKQISRGLDDIVNIKVYRSQNLPVRLKSALSDLKDTLNEYENLSRGKIKVSYIDPGDDQNLIQEAQTLGIPKLQFSNIENEQFQVSQGYYGLVLLYADKVESLPVIDPTLNLEYELTSRLAKITRKDPIKVAFSGGHDEDTGFDKLKTASQLLEQEYQITTVEVATSAGVLLDESNNLLIIAGPKKEFSRDEAYLLDQYLMKDKSILLLSGGTMVDERLSATQYDNGLNEWLNHFNLKVNKNLILDASSEIANFSTGQSYFLVPYPFWVKVLPDGLNSKHPITASLETVMLPWVSSIEIDQNKEPKPAVLLSSSKQSWEQTDVLNLDPSQQYDPTEEQLKPYNLSAIIEGELTSAYDENDRPIYLKDTTYTSSTKKGKIAVVAGQSLVEEDFITRFRANAVFFLNLVEYLASDLDLSNIRAKGESMRPLKQISDSAKGIIKYGNIFGPSLLVAVFGLVYLSKRNRKVIEK